MFHNHWRFLLLIFVVLGWSVSTLQAAPNFPTLTGRVVDNAGLLSSGEKQALTQQLRSHEDKTTNQVVVVTLKSLQGYDIADFGYQLGRHWGIGQADKNNGVLLIVAPKERKVRIEVGYGLEAKLTDALAKQIIEYDIIPIFKKKDYPGGIKAGANAILEVLGGTYDASVRKNLRKSKREIYNLFFMIVISAIVFGGFLSNYLGKLASTGVVFASGLGAGTWFGGSIIMGFVAAMFATIFHLFLNAFNGGGGGGNNGSGGGRYYGGYSSGGFGGGGSFGGGGGSFGGGGASGGW